MKKEIATVLIVVAAAAATACGASRLEATASAAGSSRVERGKDLVSIIGCSDCHTPMKMSRRGQYPTWTFFWRGTRSRWARSRRRKLRDRGSGPEPRPTRRSPDRGVSATPRISRPTATRGWAPGPRRCSSRRSGPDGTWGRLGRFSPDALARVRNATDEDLKSIYAYLRTLKPVTNHVPDVQPPAAVEAAR